MAHLEHIGQVPEVEDVVELHSSWGKDLTWKKCLMISFYEIYSGYLCTLRVEGEGGIDEVVAELLDQGVELVGRVLQVVHQDGVVDGEERLHGGEDH